MSEIMAVEEIIEAYWKQKGYWTDTRVPYRTAGGDWSDVDVLAFESESRHLVICEAKAQGQKRDVYAYTTETRDKYGNFLKYDNSTYLAFIDSLSLLLTKGVLFERPASSVSRVTVHLVSNYLIEESVRSEVDATIGKEIRKHVPRGMKCDARLDSTLDMICQIITDERENPQGKRYGNPILDLARELNRYILADLNYAGKSGKKELLHKEITTKLLGALGMILVDDASLITEHQMKTEQRSLMKYIPASEQ